MSAEQIPQHSFFSLSHHNSLFWLVDKEKILTCALNKILGWETKSSFFFLCVKKWNTKNIGTHCCLFGYKTIPILYHYPIILRQALKADSCHMMIMYIFFFIILFLTYIHWRYLLSNLLLCIKTFVHSTQKRKETEQTIKAKHTKISFSIKIKHNIFFSLTVYIRIYFFLNKNISAHSHKSDCDWTKLPLAAFA